MLTYLWRILDSVDHPDLIHLILSYLLALSEPVQSSPETPRTPHAEKARQSLLSITQFDRVEDRLSPSLFNLADLILASVQSRNSETINAALRLTGVLLLKHHTYAHSVLMRTSAFKSSSLERRLGALYQDMNTFLGLAHAVGGEEGLDEAYENSLKDALGLIELHECSSSKLGLRGVGFGAEGRSRSAILEDNSRTVNTHSILLEDPLLQALMQLLETFFTNDVETNLSLTNVIAHLASCPRSSPEGWMTADASKFKHNLDDVKLETTTRSKQEDQDEASEDLESCEDARFAAFKAACRPPSRTQKHASFMFGILHDLLDQLGSIRSTTPELDQLVASRKRAFQGAEEIEQQAKLPMRPAPSPSVEVEASRNSSESRGSRALSPSKSHNASEASSGTPRGRTNARLPGLLSRSPSARPIKSTSALDVQSHSQTPAKASGTLSPLAAVLHDNLNVRTSSSARSATSDTASLETEVFERKVKLPVRRRADGKGERGGEGSVERPSEKEASLNHVLTNIVILQEFVLEIAALIHVRASLVDEEIKFLSYQSHEQGSCPM